jgi:hypothetical protein
MLFSYGLLTKIATRKKYPAYFTASAGGMETKSLLRQYNANKSKVYFCFAAGVLKHLSLLLLYIKDTL